MQDVAQVIALAVRDRFSQETIQAIVTAMDLGRLRAQMVSLGACEPDASDLQIAKLYFSRRCSAVSPNAFFDEAWYVATYQELAPAISSGVLVSGFVHFMHLGIAEGRWPNSVLAAEAAACVAAEPELASLDERAYLAANPAAASFIAAFPSLSPLRHYNSYGRRLGYRPDRRRDDYEPDDGFRVIAASFDAAFYRASYMSPSDSIDPFDHYLRVGRVAAYSPAPWFDECWYRAFYPEVRAGIEEGWLPSGFFHYLYSGRKEGRQPRFELALALEARMPGITAPTLVRRAEELDRRLDLAGGRPLLDPSPGRSPLLWIAMPTMNPDIFFGGYRAVLWFIATLVKSGYGVVLFCVQEPPNVPYFLFREPPGPVRDAIASIKVLDSAGFASASYGSEDRFMAYSAWDLPACAALAASTSNPLPLFFVQEYEPVFYENGAHRALCEAIYDTPHFALINSAMLRNYLADARIGPFTDPTEVSSPSRHAVFSHRIAQLPRQTAASMAARGTRLLVLYARPEAHAARNVFEIAILALRRLCIASFFGPEWRFEGIGALSNLPPVVLGGGHEMPLRQKQSEGDYARTCAAMDVGISLMFAPHPSVMPFEFATTGALVVTNTYSNRSAALLRDICANIVPCSLSVAGVADAVREAVGRLGDYQARERATLTPSPARWEDVFGSDILEAALGPAPARYTTPPPVVSCLPEHDSRRSPGRVAARAARSSR